MSTEALEPEDITQKLKDDLLKTGFKRQIRFITHKKRIFFPDELGFWDDDQWNELTWG